MKGSANLITNVKVLYLLGGKRVQTRRAMGISGEIWTIFRFLLENNNNLHLYSTSFPFNSRGPTFQRSRSPSLNGKRGSRVSASITDMSDYVT